MAKFELIKAGDVLYDVHSERMGNTTMRRQGVWEVYVKEVHDGYAIVSWNGNPPQRYNRSQIDKLRKNEPKKLNGHVKGCRGYGDGRMWGKTCTCVKP